MSIPFLRRWRGPRLAVQIVMLLLGGLVIAQLVTLLLTVLLPPAPAPQYDLDAVATALRGAPAPANLEHVVQSGPPDLGGPGWLVSERSRKELAALLKAEPVDVRLSFYTPLPFAGTIATRKLAMANDGPVAPAQAWLRLGWNPSDGASLLVLAQMPAGPPPSNGTPLPNGARLPPSAGPPNRDMLPPPGGGPSGQRPGPAGGPIIDRSETTRAPDRLIRIDPTPVQGRDGIWIGGDNGETIPAILGGPQVQRGSQQQPPISGSVTPNASPNATSVTPPPVQGVGPNQPGFPGLGGQRAPLPFTPLDVLRRPAPYVERPAIAAPPVDLRRAPIVVPRQQQLAPDNPQAVPSQQLLPVAPSDTIPPPEAQANAPLTDTIELEPELPLAPRERGLFGLAPVPFVEGDFVAALRLPDGRWSVVQPAPEPFPNSWQRRVLLWFAIAFGIVAPLGWLFARRMSKPLVAFAEAAEQLGRDPTAPVLDLDGPAEVGRAAHAFNLMQSRVKSFVGDRTAMIGAISHDLRTPLTRLRFRAEEIDDDMIRDGIIEEVEEMEEMISSVLAFIRDASTPGVRERIDLRTIVEDVAEDAAVVGNDIGIEAMPSAIVDVDVMGMRRLFANLFENAAKYGDHARVRLTTDNGEAVAQVIDEGPGVPEEDLERAFEPFYRAASARATEKRGSGLGLAVCRSIARAHGGDVLLKHSSEGFLAELRVPLAFASTDEPVD